MSALSGDQPHTRSAVAMRRRAGRGGRMHYDRRILLPRSARPLSPKPTDDYLNRRLDFPNRSSTISPEDQDEFARRISERWRYDQDDSPPVVPEGAEELDRALIDDYDPKYEILYSTS
jgi:enhancer of polycomb-like protein